jgi:uncharacterized protein YigE (DUF2233 family)
MRTRTLLVWIAIALLAFTLLTMVRRASRPRWTPLREGVEFAMLRGDPFCRRGSSEIAVLRIDPARVRVRVLHYTRQPEHAPLSIVEWQRRSGALAVFNAGQFYPDLSYMGVLISDGEKVSARLHPGFKAALVAAPSDGRRAARVIDLDREPLDLNVPAWREVAQSFMLFDRDGHARIRKTDQVANRTVVGEDEAGRLVIVTSEGGYTLWDFSHLLRTPTLGLTHAMAMDGGYEAEMCVSSGPFHYASFGHWTGENADAPGARVPLPAVIAVMSP